jgi:hypothetical protein
MLSTLVLKARAVCDQESHPEELEFICSMFKQNGYSDGQIHHALYPPCRENTPREEPISMAFLPFVGPIFNNISVVLVRYNIRTVGLLPGKVSSFLWPIKDDLDLKTADV